MTELFPISQPPTEADGDANGEVFFIDTDLNKYLGRWDDSSYINDSEFQHWARTEFNPPKRPSRIGYGETSHFKDLSSGDAFLANERLYMVCWGLEESFNAIELQSGKLTVFLTPDIVTPVTFE